MNSKRHVMTIVVLFCSLAACSNDEALPFGDREACMQGSLAQFGQYIGNWAIEDWNLSQDGKEWSKGDGANWDFVCLGNGTAVQDFWMPNGGAIGTNLRTYNEATESWDIAWAISSAPGFAQISATQDENKNIIMHYVSPHPGPKRRITFYPPKNNSWDWKMELANDDGETWAEVYRIRATRRE